jgi:hypothetical protein
VVGKSTFVGEISWVYAGFIIVGDNGAEKAYGITHGCP